MRARFFSKVFLPALFLMLAGSLARAAAVVELEVDATELPRKLLHTRMTFPGDIARTNFWYPKWIPGIHAPRGPIENMAGLRFKDADGKSVSWLRDDVELYEFHCDSSSAGKPLVVEFDYICNQPNGNSGGIDSYGNAFIGSINWNTCVLYPDGVASDAILYHLKLRVPDGWKIGTALKIEEQSGNTITFKPVTLEVLVDSPLICGAYLRTLEYSPAGFPKFYFHLNSESSAAVQIPDAVDKQFRNLTEQLARLFKSAPFDEYHFLITASDEFPGMGLEHSASSMNGMSEGGLTKPNKRRLNLDVLTHEVVHAWCGKFRQPAGMATPNFHDPKRTKLLWVYEGLTQYLGHILYARSGFITPAETVDDVTAVINGQQLQKGREWRPLEDTARDSWQLRGRSKSWSYWRRNQDYYNDGMLVWMEVDAMLRRGTDGHTTLDDFCATFFRHTDGDGRVKPFDEQEIYSVLNNLMPYDWRKFFESHIKETQEVLPLGFVEKLGYRLEYDREIGGFEKLLEDENHYVRAWNSLGIGVRSNGSVMDVVPGSPADKAGLAPGMEIAGVNNRKFSEQRLKDGIADSVTRHGVELLTLNGDEFKTIHVDYDGGPRYLKLVRNPTEPDLLTKVFTPKD
ncbi:hypothetical protein GC207_05145 [bacterium]|nr:hypothetical protein [bacterium]